jgi:nitrite reductase (NADH) small subunit
MAEFIRICAQSELPQPGNLREFSVSGRTLCVANIEGAIRVLDGICPHEGGPLAEGTIDQGCIVCPWHSYAFNLHTGEAEGEPTLKAEVFEATIEGGELRVKL